MKKTFYIILGTILLLPINISDVFGIDIDTFKKDVYRPDNLPAGTALQDVPAETKINSIIDFAVDLILYASGAVAVFMLVLGGIRYITSLGNQERMEESKKTVQYALGGLVAIILAYAAVTNIISLIFKATV